MTEELSKALSDFVQSVTETFLAFGESVKAAFAEYTDIFGQPVRMLAAYKAAEIERPKWVHMASHAKRKRIRKKYHDRIMREYGGESNGQA